MVAECLKLNAVNDVDDSNDHHDDGNNGNIFLNIDLFAVHKLLINY